MTGQVLRRSTDRDAALEDLEPDVGPFAYWLKIDATVDESLCEISSPCAQRVRANRDWPRDFVRFEELDSLDMVPSVDQAHMRT